MQSKVGACLWLEHIPVHPLLYQYEPLHALDRVLRGGDDYELCFTVPPQHETRLLQTLEDEGIICYPIGVIESQQGLRLRSKDEQVTVYEPRGYRHF